MKLITKIQIFVILLLILVTSAELILFLNKEEERLVKIRKDMCLTLINKMESDVKYAVTIKNKKFLSNILKNYANINFIEDIDVFLGDKEYFSLNNKKIIGKYFVEKQFKFIDVFEKKAAIKLTSLKIKIFYNINDIKEVIKGSLIYLLTLLIISIIVSLIIIYIFLERFLSPLEKFLFTIRATINGEYRLMDLPEKSEFLPVFKAYNQLILNLKDKIKGLEEANIKLKNNILEIQNLQDMIIRQEKLASLGTITAGIAHEINNPVSAIRGLSELALLLKNRNKYEEYFGKIIEHCDRIKDIVRRVRDVTQEIDSKKMENVKIKDIINDVIELCRNAKIITNKVKIDGNYKYSNVSIKCIRNQMFQVFQNLITNSVQAMDGNGEIRIDIKNIENSLVDIIFSDSGPGIPYKIRDKIFDPFFTTKGPTGTGLGLYIVYGIIKNHKGNIEILRSKKGARFKITLPLEP